MEHIAEPVGELGLTFYAGERPASRSVSPDSEREWLIRVATLRSPSLPLLSDMLPNGSFGKMCPASIPLGAMRRTVARPRQPSKLEKKLSDWEENSDLTPKQQESLESLRRLIKPTILTASCPDWSNSGMGSRTGFLTLNSSEWPSAAAVCSLSDILEDSGSVPRRFYLTAKACAGILRRAGKRGKELPEALAHALKAVADSERTSN